MKPGLVLPRIHPNAAVLGERIDEHIKVLAEQVNGGLTAHNMAPSTALSSDSFAENCSLYTLTAYADSDTPGNYLEFGTCSVQIDRILGISWSIMVLVPAFQRQMTLKTENTWTPIVRIPMNATSTTYTNSRGQIMMSGAFVIDNNAAGTLHLSRRLAVTYTGTGSEVMRGCVSITMLANHTVTP